MITRICSQVAALAVVFSLAIGCGGGNSPLPLAASQPDLPPPDTSSPYGITAFVTVNGHPEQSGWKRIPPADWGTWGNLGFQTKPGQQEDGGAAAGGQQPSVFGAGHERLQATVDRDGSAPIDTSVQDSTSNYAPGWSLLYWATIACLNAAQSETTPDFDEANAKAQNDGDFSGFLPAALDVAPAPWLNQTYYNIWAEAVSDPSKIHCDAQLFMQETLLCAADHLAQIGDSPGTVTWSGTNVPQNLAPPETISVTVPPQRTQDLFIARDMALNALAHALRLDTQSQIFCLPGGAGCSSFNESTCTHEYASMALTGTLPQENVLGVTNNAGTHVGQTSKYFDPTRLDFSSSADLMSAGKRRLTRKASFLTAAARLAKDLVERSVQDDIAGAQQQLGANSDERVGARAAWGATDPNNGYLPLVADSTRNPYNTFRHALRTTFGRLEIGNYLDPATFDVRATTRAFPPGPFTVDWSPHFITRDDPRCSPWLNRPVGALDLVFSIPGISARWDDTPPKTKGERLALDLLDRAGIVIPNVSEALVTLADSSADAAAGDAGTPTSYSASLRAAILNLTLSDAADRANPDPTQPADPDFATSPEGKILTALLAPESISDSELSFAAQRTYDAFRLLTGTDMLQVASGVSSSLQLNAARVRTQIAADHAGLTSRICPMNNAGCPLVGIAALGGIAISGGLPRSDLSVDPMASLGAVQGLSQCNLDPVLGDPAGSTVNNRYTLTQQDYVLGPHAQDVSAFQDVFMMGEGFRRQLAIIGDEATAQGATTLTDVASFARTAAAEVREWAGPGTLMMALDSSFNRVLYFMNIAPSDLGAASTDELTQRIVLVPSPSDPCRLGPCSDLLPLGGLAPAAPPDALTGLRSSKPQSIASIAPTDNAGLVTPDPRVGVGLDNPTIKLTFPAPTSDVPAGYHVVLLPFNGKPGKVLGWLRSPVDAFDWVTGAYSNEQRQLATRIFGLGPSEQTTRSCTNIAPLSLPRDYCITEMKRDQFVPLANELNSSGTSTSIDDSWKNYLDLAQASADKADQLGAQLIQQGLDQDLRKESATEDLGNLCGAYTSVDDVSTNGGNVVAPQDQQLAQCVQPDKVDLVFLREDPFDDGSGDLVQKGRSTDVWDAYCTLPVSAATPPACSRPRGSVITHAGLGFSTSKAAPVDGDLTKACAALTPSLTKLNGGTAQVDIASLGDGLHENWSTAPGIMTTLQNLHLTETDTGEWVLEVGHHVVAGSDALVTSEVMASHVGSLKDVWPQCNEHSIVSDGCSKTGTFVGSIFGPAPSLDTTNYWLRDRIEQVVFYMGAMAGQIPPATINIPVPLANRSTSSVSQAVIPAPALYGPSFYLTSGTGTYSVQPTAQGSGGTSGALLVTAWNDSGIISQAKPFTTAAHLNSMAARYQSDPGTAWQALLYNQAAAHVSDNGYLFTQTSNAAIDFDDALGPGVDRKSLQSWLSARATNFNAIQSGDGSQFLQDVETATFLTTLTHASEGQPVVPVRFCSGSPGTYLHGRSVCVHAPASPTFFYTYDQFGGTEGCAPVGPTPESNLVVTATAFLGTDCQDASGGTLPDPRDCTAADVAGAGAITGVHGVPTAGSFLPLDLAAGQAAGAPPWWYWWYAPSAGAAADQSQSLFTDITPISLASAGVQSQFIASSQTAPNAFPNSLGSLLGYLVDTNEVRSPLFKWGQFFAHDRAETIWKDRLRPLFCPPEQRVEMFLNTDPQNSPVAAMQSLVQGLALSCLFDNQNLTVDLAQLPPPIKTTADIGALEAWENLLGYDIDQIPNALLLVDLPADLIPLAKSGQSNLGAVTAGDRGKLLLDLQAKLNLLENGFSTLGSTMQQISSAIDSARNNLQSAQDANTVQQLTISAARLDNDREIALDATRELFGIAKLAAATTTGISVSSAFDSGSHSGQAILAAGEEIATSQVDAMFALQKMQNLDDQANAQNKVEQDAERTAVLNLSNATQSLYQTVNDNITGLKNNNDAILEDVAALNQNAQKATLDLAKAAGADFMEVNGKQVPLHVNTVYRRQFDLTKQRYGIALEAAKRAAYLARLSIEQRLGVRLDQLHENIGPMEAPATWVDDLCSVQGVNYDKLRQGSGQPSTSPGEIDLIKGLANQFVGDYVSKLRQFVQFYNVQFPFADANDVALVSLREDLAASLTQCTGPSSNLLLQSDRLGAMPTDLSASSMVSHGGWRTTSCVTSAATADAGSQVACLQLADEITAAGTDGGAPDELATPNPTGHATLLAVRPFDSSTAKVPLGAPVPVQSAAPRNAVFQTLALKSSTRYLLSWWDMARNADGAPYTSSATPGQYTVGIFDANWSVVSIDSVSPTTSTNGVTWGDRHSLEVIAPADGDYNVLFTAGPSDSTSAAIAIADVQLEIAADNTGGATPYVSNGSTLQHTNGRCPVDTPEQFRTRFKHVCDSLACWFELKDTLAIDTQLVNQGSSSLVGKVAAGNFNYRNNTVAVNVVGTGVIDCSRAQGASCNGSAYVNYDLQHVAYNVPLDNYEGGITCFDFGAGNIRGAKALAAERFLTLPMSSSDRDFVDQSPFLKPEFSGRPLSGSYRLRIMDEPQLVWENVNDVQIVMNYSYWSKVDRSPGN